MIEIRDAVFTDLPEILQLQKFCYRENAQRYRNPRISPMTQTLEEIELEFHRCHFIKVTDESAIIGSIRGCLEDVTCFIARIFVHPDHQDKGIGTSLMNAMENHFDTVDRYELFTGYKDEKNLYFYKKLGYTLFKKNTRIDGITFYYLEKRNDTD